MLVIPGLPSYNGVEVYYLKGVIGLPTVISFRDRGYIHIFFFFLEMGSLMTSSSSAGLIQIPKFPEPWFRPISDTAELCLSLTQQLLNTSTGSKMDLLKYSDKYGKVFQYLGYIW